MLDADQREALQVLGLRPGLGGVWVDVRHVHHPRVDAWSSDLLFRRRHADPRVGLLALLPWRSGLACHIPALGRRWQARPASRASMPVMRRPSAWRSAGALSPMRCPGARAAGSEDRRRASLWWAIAAAGVAPFTLGDPPRGLRAVDWACSLLRVGRSLRHGRRALQCRPRGSSGGRRSGAGFRSGRRGATGGPLLVGLGATAPLIVLEREILEVVNRKIAG